MKRLGENRRDGAKSSDTKNLGRDLKFSSTKSYLEKYGYQSIS